MRGILIGVYNKKYLNKFLYFIVDIFFLSSISFISWHYIGVIYILFWILVYVRIDRIANNNFKKYFIESFKIVFALLSGSIFWFFELYYGLHALSLIFLLYLLVFLSSYFLNILLKKK